MSLRKGVVPRLSVEPTGRVNGSGNSDEAESGTMVVCDAWAVAELDESAQWRVGCEEGVRDDWDESTIDEIWSVSTELSDTE